MKEGSRDSKEGLAEAPASAGQPSHEDPESRPVLACATAGPHVQGLVVVPADGGSAPRVHACWRLQNER